MDDCFHFDDDCHFCNEIDGSKFGDGNRRSELFFEEQSPKAVETMSLGAEEDFFTSKELDENDDSRTKEEADSNPDLVTGLKCSRSGIAMFMRPFFQDPGTKSEM